MTPIAKISVRSEIGVLVKTLGRQVAGRAGARGDGENLRDTAEVNELEIERVVAALHEDVLGLQVAMHEIEPQQLLRRAEQETAERDRFIDGERAGAQQRLQGRRLDEFHRIAARRGVRRNEGARKKSESKRVACHISREKASSILVSRASTGANFSVKRTPSRVASQTRSLAGNGLTSV